MAIIVSGISLPLQEPAEAALELAAQRMRLDPAALRQAYIIKAAVDARHSPDIRMVYTVGLETEADEEGILRRAGDGRAKLRRPMPFSVEKGGAAMAHRPVVVGFGPAGMFAALLLAREGYRPLVLERGCRIDARMAAVQNYWRTGRLEPESNVQFGEGGAGTFSDGKLTTRINDPRCDFVSETLVRFGAPAQAMQRAKPHLGTDRLRGIVENIREEILRLGGEIRFETRMTGLALKNGKVSAVETPDGTIPAETVVLAIGHSARDTFSMLMGRGIVFSAKPFSVGVRIEHRQSLIDSGLYKEAAGHPALGPGEYQLSQRRGERGVYTFCMCPGGVVVPAASEAGGVVTNGMSEYARDGENANAALVVSVGPADFGEDPREAIAFQRRLEQAAFSAGGGDGRAPAQNASSFLAGSRPAFGAVTPSYALGVTPYPLTEIFPDAVGEMLRLGLRRFDSQIPGFAGADSVMTGVETRTSSPVRILRGETLQAAGAAGLYPCGEGAGYAGGIVSAAVDGLRVAEEIMRSFLPPVETEEG